MYKNLEKYELPERCPACSGFRARNWRKKGSGWLDYEEIPKKLTCLIFSELGDDKKCQEVLRKEHDVYLKEQEEKARKENCLICIMCGVFIPIQEQVIEEGKFIPAQKEHIDRGYTICFECSDAMKSAPKRVINEDGTEHWEEPK